MAKDVLNFRVFH